MNKLTRRAVGVAGFGVAGFALMLATSASFAQQPPPVRVRGEITKVDGTTLAVKARDGSNLTVKLAEPPRIAAMDKASLDDIKEGTFVGVIGDAAGRRQPEGLRDPHLPGLAEGRGRRPVPAMGQPAGQHHDQRLCGHQVAGKDGRELLVKYKDGEKKVIVPPDTIIAKYAPGSAADLKVGAKGVRRAPPRRRPTAR